MNSEEICSFLDKTNTIDQTISEIKAILDANQFIQIKQSNNSMLPAKGYFINENQSLIAFQNKQYDSAVITCIPYKTPLLKINNQFQEDFSFVSLSSNISSSLEPWSGCDIRLIGNFYVQSQNQHTVHHFDSKDPIGFIHPLSSQPVFCEENMQKFIMSKLELDSNAKITGGDLSFVDGKSSSILGANREFISSSHLTSGSSTYAALHSFINSQPINTLNLFYVGNIDPHYLFNILNLIIPKEKFYAVIANSLLVYCTGDNALHPNFMKQFSEQNASLIGKSIVMKTRADGNAANDITAIFSVEKAAEKLRIKPQRSIPQTIYKQKSFSEAGKISAEIGCPLVELALPILSQSSIREMAALKDIYDESMILHELYSNYNEIRL